MSWVDIIGRDPVPWLLDPGNPSARFLTLKHIFGKPAASLQEEQARILAWAPVAMLRRHWVPINFWGRAASPYYGGPMGNFGTLFLLTQLGTPRISETDAVCENLLERGRMPDGSFAPGDKTAAPWLAYTGIALQILTHFGYENDPRTQQTWDVLTQTVQKHPDTLGCTLAGRGCRAAAVKALGALVHRDRDRPLESDAETIEILCTYLLSHTYEWGGQDIDWTLPRFPRYYETDLVELTHMLAHTEHRSDPECRQVIQRMVDLASPVGSANPMGSRDPSGRWIKAKTTPALSEERILQPSRWLTFEAVHALILIYGDEIYAP
jgi:hypothetical protein